MPTVKRVRGFVIKVNVRDEHEPPHVHVVKGGGDVRIAIADGPACLLSVKRPMGRQEAREAELLVRECQAECLAVWEKYHGPR